MILDILISDLRLLKENKIYGDWKRKKYSCYYLQIIIAYIVYKNSHPQIYRYVKNQ